MTQTAASMNVSLICFKLKTKTPFRIWIFPSTDCFVTFSDYPWKRVAQCVSPPTTFHPTTQIQTKTSYGSPWRRARDTVACCEKGWSWQPPSTSPSWIWSGLQSRKLPTSFSHCLFPQSANGMLVPGVLTACVMVIIKDGPTPKPLLSHRRRWGSLGISAQLLLLPLITITLGTL